MKQRLKGAVPSVSAPLNQQEMDENEWGVR
jgi:hypothetical protein